MDQRRAVQIGRWQVLAGWVTTFAMLIARAYTVADQITRGHLDIELFVTSVFKLGILAVLVLHYRRYLWPSYFLIGLWPFGFALTLWFAHPPAEVIALGILVGVAFFLGARGMRTLQTLDKI